MNNFISNIVSRHIGKENKVLPGLPGLYSNPFFHHEKNADRFEEQGILNETPFTQKDVFNTPIQKDGIEKQAERFETGLESKQPPPLKYFTEKIIEKSSGNTRINLSNEGETKTRPLLYDHTELTKTNAPPEKDDHNDFPPLMQQRNEKKDAQGSIHEKSGLNNTTEHHFFNVNNIILPEKKNLIKKSEVRPLQPSLALPDPLWGNDLKEMIKNRQPAHFSNPEKQTVIKVNIGRIDVRAVAQPAQVKTRTDTKPALSLDDFLKTKKTN